MEVKHTPGPEMAALAIAKNALANEARRVGPLTIQEMEAVFSRLEKTVFWHSKRSDEEREAGRVHNAIAYERFGAASAEQWKQRCQYLLDVLDGQGFAERDMAEEDELAIIGIRAALATTEGRS
jgi:hypothetical protein